VCLLCTCETLASFYQYFVTDEKGRRSFLDAVLFNLCSVVLWPHSSMMCVQALLLCSRPNMLHYRYCLSVSCGLISRKCRSRKTIIDVNTQL